MPIDELSPILAPGDRLGAFFMSASDHNLGLSQPVASPIYPSTVYSLPDLDALERINDGLDAGYSYARDNHPNAAELASHVAAMHDAKWGVIAASGMGAISATLLSLLKSGDHVVASDQLYGGTMQLLRQQLPRFGITTTWVDFNDLPAVEGALRKPTQILFAEKISNPLVRVCDLKRLADMARAHDAMLIVDNTFATPVLCKLLTLGADVVIESMTKLMGGHSDVTLGGAFGNDPIVGENVTVAVSRWGMNGSPFDCWLATRSLATLELRARASNHNAAELARWLEKHPKGMRIHYPGLPSHPDYEHATNRFGHEPGNMLSIELQGGRDAVNAFMRRGTGIPFAPSLGGTVTTCSYPAGTSHKFVDKAEKDRLGITEGLIRLSVGIEPLEEIVKNVASKLE